MEPLNSNDAGFLRQKLNLFKILTFLFAGISVVLLIVIIVLAVNPSQNGRWDQIASESVIIPTIEIAFNGTISENSPAYYNRTLDIKNSPYYPVLNFYDGTITETLSILKGFKTYQQTTSFTGGCASAYMALRYLGIENISENDIGQKVGATDKEKTLPSKMKQALLELAGDKIEVVSSFDNSTKMEKEEFIQMIEQCTNPVNKCVLVLANNERGGHWMTLIGYDNIGTLNTEDDVLIFADPYDTIDHNQDGYYVTSFQKYFDGWDVVEMSEEEKYQPYIKITSKNKSD